MKPYSLGSMVRVGVWGALLGSAVGFGLGLLLAPEAGRNTRRKLAYQLDHLSEKLSTTVDNWLNPEASGDDRRQGDALVAEAQVKAQRIREDMDALLQQTRPGK